MPDVNLGSLVRVAVEIVTAEGGEILIADELAEAA